MNETFSLHPNRWKSLNNRIPPQGFKLSEEVATQIDGKREKIVALLQERYGFSKEQAEYVLNDFLIKSR